MNVPDQCPLCATSEPETTHQTHRQTDRQYSLYECVSCGVQFWWPLQNPGGHWYAHQERYVNRNQDLILQLNKKQTDVLDFLGQERGRLLDVGCGVGNFLALAKARGWECWGIDFDKNAIAAGKRAFGLERIEVMSLAEFAAGYRGPRFDLITFFDVFEHLDNHNEFLEIVKKLLAPGGRIALSVPYRGALRWLLPNDFPPAHLTRWNEHALEHGLYRHSFHILMLRLLPATLYFIVLKLKFRYGMWSSLGLVGKAKRSRTLRKPSGDLLSSHLSLRIRILEVLAKTKDLIVFGIPALVLWLVLLPTCRRYTDFYVVAELSPPGSRRMKR